MKEFKNKKVLPIQMKRLIMILMLLFLLSCAPSNPKTPQEMSGITKYVRSGLQGIDMQYIENLPPYQLYDTSELTAIVELRNLGSHDISEDECVVTLSGYDPHIIRSITERKSCGQLEGKDEYMIDGGYNMVEFSSSSISLPGEIDLYNPNLVASVCYKYTTVANPQVCIDPHFYDLSSDQRICEVRDVSLAGGQGAPVAVSFVNVDMVNNRAIFQIDVTNVGTGRIISPQVGINHCPLNLRYNDFDELRYNVELSGASLLRCSPENNLVRLVNGRGRIICSFDIGNTQAYTTPLRIELDYNYLSSIRKQVEIIRTPQ